MIKITNLNFKYKNTDNILENINIDIQDGETVAIMGENGSGKSTLGKLISGILKPKQGKIIIDNIDTSKKENYKHIIKNVGIVFQNPENQIIFNNIYDEMSFSLKELSKDEVKSKVLESLEKVKMSELVDRDLYELSLGQKQRIAIAEILARNPKYIVFDEPTTMIDSAGKEEIYNIIKQLKKDGYTIIYITNLSEEILLADRILILEEGKIVAEVRKENLMENIDVLTKYNVKLPITLELALKLGIKKNLKNYSIDELADAIKEINK